MSAAKLPPPRPAARPSPGASDNEVAESSLPPRRLAPPRPVNRTPSSRPSPAALKSVESNDEQTTSSFDDSSNDAQIKNDDMNFDEPPPPRQPPPKQPPRRAPAKAENDGDSEGTPSQAAARKVPERTKPVPPNGQKQSPMPPPARDRPKAVQENGLDESTPTAAAVRKAPERQPGTSPGPRIPPPRPQPGSRTPPERPQAVPRAGASPAKGDPSPIPALPRRPSTGAIIASERRLSKRLSGRLDISGIDEADTSQESAETAPPPQTPQPVVTATATPVAKTVRSGGPQPPPPRSGNAGGGALPQRKSPNLPAPRSLAARPNTATQTTPTQTRPVGATVPPPRPTSMRPISGDGDVSGVKVPTKLEGISSTKELKPVLIPRLQETLNNTMSRKPVSKIPQRLDQDSFDDGVEADVGFLFKVDLPIPKPHSGVKREYKSSFSNGQKASVVIEKNLYWNPV